MRKTTTARSRVLGSLFGLLVLLGCTRDGDGARAGGHTNWLPCQKFADCSGHLEAVACTDGYCVDVSGERLPGASNAGRDSEAELDGADGVSDIPAEGGARDGSTAADGGGDENGNDAGSAAVDADTQPADAGTRPVDADAQSSDAAPEGTPCGPTICPPRSHCCDACMGICIPEFSGANCPGGAPGTLCSDGGIANVRIPECPGPTERCASERCLDGMPCVTCPAGQLCLELDLSCGPAGGSAAQCVDWPCGDPPLSDACAEAVCRSVEPSGLFFTANAYTQENFLLGPGDPPFVGCAGGGVCAAPDTPIATPQGEVPIAQLRPGDLVYSLHAGRLAVVPLRAVARTPVYDHRVVQLVLDRGVLLEISAPHPLANGRLLGTLRTGDQLDGHVVLSAELVDYAYSYTHDILPASDSGAYLAGGLWLGSTLL